MALLKAALPVFLAIALGMLCRKTGFLSREGVDALKKVVLNITLPAVLLNAFLSAEYSQSTIAIPVTMYVLCLGCLGLGVLLAKLFRCKSPLVPFFATGFEAGMLGYALFTLLYPQQSTGKFAILDIGQTLFVFTTFKILLSGARNPKVILKDMATSPILWAVAVGVLLGATGVYQRLGVWQGVVDSVTDFVSAPTAMLILLTVGYDLVPREIPWKKTLGYAALRLVVMGVFVAVMVLINRGVLENALFEGAIVLMAILPPPYVIPVFSDDPRQRNTVSAVLSGMTLITLILFALLTLFPPI